MEPFLNPAQTIADLRSAVEHIITHAWGQGEDYNELTDRYCAYGSIRAAIGGLVVDESGVRDMDRFATDANPNYEQVRVLRDRASNCARAFYRAIGIEITVCNDNARRTKTEMIAALEKTIDVLEKDPNRA